MTPPLSPLSLSLFFVSTKYLVPQHLLSLLSLHRARNTMLVWYVDHAQCNGGRDHTHTHTHTHTCSASFLFSPSVKCIIILLLYLENKVSCWRAHTQPCLPCDMPGGANKPWRGTHIHKQPTRYFLVRNQPHCSVTRASA